MRQVCNGKGGGIEACGMMHDGGAANGNEEGGVIMNFMPPCYSIKSVGSKPGASSQLEPSQCQYSSYLSE